MPGRGAEYCLDTRANPIGDSSTNHAVETRSTDLSGFRLPTWEEVVGREYEPWDREHIVIDTAGQDVEQSVTVLLAALASIR